jgi:hypothetical protein
MMPKSKLLRFTKHSDNSKKTTASPPNGTSRVVDPPGGCIPSRATENRTLRNGVSVLAHVSKSMARFVKEAQSTLKAKASHTGEAGLLPVPTNRPLPSLATSWRKIRFWVKTDPRRATAKRTKGRSGPHVPVWNCVHVHWLQGRIAPVHCGLVSRIGCGAIPEQEVVLRPRRFPDGPALTWAAEQQNRELRRRSHWWRIRCSGD